LSALVDLSRTHRSINVRIASPVGIAAGQQN
jgi:hypothetical protein